MDIDQTLTACFEEQVVKHPDRVCARVGGESVTYNELNRAANRVAREVMKRGLAEQEPVAVLVHRGLTLIVAILGVLKAGRICVPVDPAFPRARIRDILKGSLARLVLVEPRSLAAAREAADNEPRLLDVCAIPSRGHPENPRISSAPEDLAFILFTSGSSGRPKGVLRDHRTMLHHVANYARDADVGGNDRLLFLGSAFERDIFRGLLSGATIYPVDIRDEGLAGLADLLVREEITICHCGATTFRHFAAFLNGSESFSSLRLIYLSGEPVRKADVDLFRKHFPPQSVLVNSFGTTEAPTFCRYFIDRDTEITGNVVPVGFPVADKRVLLLDESGGEVGRGLVGEIAVRSRFLSPGYWRSPELTKAAFTPDPHGGQERLYRTGDLGCMQADGCLVHLGRGDHQVTIRGHRVELEEVEATMANLPEVQQAAVKARSGAGGVQRLVAYVVLRPHPGIAHTALRHRLAAELPDHMVPSTFVELTSLPVTAAGKVDRAALPEPPQQSQEPFGELPRTETERQIG